MIHEFAVDPISINNWNNFRTIVGNFGIEYGRLISRFPRRWEKMVYEACKGCQDVKLKTIEEMLARIKPKLISMNREYDAGKNWLENAEDQHRKKPFRAIITTENPVAKEYLLVAEMIYNGMGRPWDVRREKPITRSPEAIADCSSMLLWISKEIILVDPHFDPTKKRFTRTFSTLIIQAFQHIDPARIELHVKHTDVYGLDVQDQLRDWHDVCLARLRQFIPKGFRVKVIKWKQKDHGEKFHARYIMTEKGAFRYDVGLDAGNEGETTDVSILDQTLYDKRWKDHQKETAAYDLVDEFEIEGVLV